MLYSCNTHTATVGVKGLKLTAAKVNLCNVERGRTMGLYRSEIDEKRVKIRNTRVFDQIVVTTNEG